MSGNSCQGRHQTALKAGRFGSPLWVTLSGYGGFEKGLQSWGDLQRLIIVDVLRYVSESSFESIRLGMAWARIRESLHTMLLTVSKSEPVSAGMFITNKVLCSSTYQPFHFHQHHSSSTCPYRHPTVAFRTVHTMEIFSTQFSGHVGKAFTHQRY